MGLFRVGIPDCICTEYSHTQVANSTLWVPILNHAPNKSKEFLFYEVELISCNFFGLTFPTTAQSPTRNICYTRTRGSNPLYFAFRDQNIDLTNWLLGKGADPNAPIIKDTTRLNLAATASWIDGIHATGQRRFY